MPGKSNVYTLGEFGVNRVLSPVHLIDGELLAAQNADVPFEKGNRGLRKRSGMAKHNEVAAAGAILSMTNIPIPDPFPDYYVPLITEGDVLDVVTSTDGGSSQFYQTSADGITWTFGAASIPSRPSAPTGGVADNHVLQHGGFVTLADGLYFLDAVDGHLMRWDGTTLTQMTSNTLADVSTMTACTALELHLGDLFAIGNATPAPDTVICRFTGTAWASVVTKSAWLAQAAVSANGVLCVPSDDQRMGTWSEDDGFVDDGSFTGASNGRKVTDMAVCPWAGLVVTFAADNLGAPGLWELRNGTWTDITPGAGTGCWGPMAVFDGVLYVARHSDPLLGTFVGAEVYSYDGTTVAVDQDLTTVAADVSEVLSMVAFNDALYLVAHGTSEPSRHVLRRSTVGVYTAVIAEDSISQAAPRREIGLL